MIFKFPFFKMKKKQQPPKDEMNNNNKMSDRETQWELRPGGMLVQKRINVGDESLSPMINIQVSYASSHYHLTVPAQSTFGELKRVLLSETGLEPNEQRLLYKGKEKENEEYLHIAGVKEMSKVILLEDPASRERKLQEMITNQTTLKASQQVSKLRCEVTTLSDKVVALETNLCGGTRVSDNDFVVLMEMLMLQLLKLDAIEAEGEVKVQKRFEICRIQSLLDTLEHLKATNSKLSEMHTKVTQEEWLLFD